MIKQNAHTLFSCSVTTVAALGLSPSIACAQDTQIDDVIMYGIDADTFNLLRYEFSTDTFTIVGKVQENQGPVVKDVEGLAYIPHGFHKGLYGTTNFNDNQPTRLIEINPFDASAYMYPDVVGFWKVSGLVVPTPPGGPSSGRPSTPTTATPRPSSSRSTPPRASALRSWISTTSDPAPTGS